MRPVSKILTAPIRGTVGGFGTILEDKYTFLLLRNVIFKNIFSAYMYMYIFPCYL